MRFTLYNLTDGPIQASNPSDDVAGPVLLHSKRSTFIPRFHGMHLHLSTLPEDAAPSEGGLEQFRVRLPGFWAKRGATWKALHVSDDSPWRIYWFWPAKALVVLPRRNMSSFLADMPDTLSLASLALPGTHDTMAFYGWPISQCQSQSTPLSAQFLEGIRVIDIRLALVPIGHTRHPPPPAPGSTTLPTPKFKLVAYHGVFPERTPFSTILNNVHDFLTSPAGATETIVMSIKQEDFATKPLALFSQLVKEEIMNGPGGFKDTDEHGNRDLGIWYLQNRIPNLGEVRGKVVLFSRFGGNGAGWEGGLEGLGIHPSNWPDSDKQGFVWNLKGMTVRTHDWYAIPSFLSIPEKVSLATVVLQPNTSFPLPATRDGKKEGKKTEKSTAENAVDGAASFSTDETMLNIGFLSAATFPLALPPTVAKGFGWPGFKIGFEGVNARVGRWFLEELVPELKTFSPTKSASAPKAVENGDGAVKQSVENAVVAGTASNPSLAKGTNRLRWLRPGVKKPAARNDSESDLLEEPSNDTQVQSPVVNGSRLRGWAMMDFYSEEKALVPLLVEFNHQARKSGEEGWP